MAYEGAGGIHDHRSVIGHSGDKSCSIFQLKEVLLMGKIAPISYKYIIHAEFKADGTVDKPDVIGAIFGQTEGLLGSDLELRELQKSGKIGRIEVETEVSGGRTKGMIMIPSSMDMAETAIIAASLETIDRVGPCNAKIKVLGLEDVRESKREYILKRTKELLHELMEKGPKSTEIIEKIKQEVRELELTTYGPEKLPAGPDIDTADEVIVVEGRADVITLLRNGIKNVIAMNGTSVPKTIIDLSKRKTMVAFVDGDRGGDLNAETLISVADIDFIAKAPAGKEVEELTSKEIHKALRARIPVDQYVHEMKQEIPREWKNSLRRLLNDVIGSRGVYVLDENLNILGKVPLKELKNALKDLNEAYIVVADGQPDIRILEGTNVEYLVVSKYKGRKNSKINVITARDLE